MNQEFERQNGDHQLGGGLVVAERNRAVQPAAVPGVQRRTGGADDLPFDRVVAVALRQFRTGRPAQHRDRVQQVIGQPRNVELTARGLLFQIIGSNTVDYLLKNLQRRLGTG